MFKSPVRKLVAFFEKSRNGWKEKYRAAKSQGKYWSNQARAVMRSRDAWRAKAEASARELEQVRQELAALQKTSRA
jgi:hypothetical protein